MHHARFKAIRVYLQPDDVEEAIRVYARDNSEKSAQYAIDYQIRIPVYPDTTPSAEVVFYMREDD